MVSKSAMLVIVRTNAYPEITQPFHSFFVI